MCEKVGYSSEREARTALNYFKHGYGRKKWFKRDRFPCAFYKCQYCGEYHLTSHVDHTKRRYLDYSVLY